MTAQDPQIQGRITDISWGGIELENNYMTRVAPVFITVRISSNDLAGLDISRPITISQNGKENDQ